jgi:hypothetical protein
MPQLGAALEMFDEGVAMMRLNGAAPAPRPPRRRSSAACGRGRPQDEVDPHALLEVAGLGDLDAAADAIELITRRGAWRDRDLRREWQAVVAARSAVVAGR